MESFLKVIFSIATLYNENEDSKSQVPQDVTREETVAERSRSPGKKLILCVPSTGFPTLSSYGFVSYVLFVL